MTIQKTDKSLSSSLPIRIEVPAPTCCRAGTLRGGVGDLQTSLTDPSIWEAALPLSLSGFPLRKFPPSAFFCYHLRREPYGYEAWPKNRANNQFRHGASKA